MLSRLALGVVWGYKQAELLSGVTICIMGISCLIGVRLCGIGETVRRLGDTEFDLGRNTCLSIPGPGDTAAGGTGETDWEIGEPYIVTGVLAGAIGVRLLRLENGSYGS